MSRPPDTKLTGSAQKHRTLPLSAGRAGEELHPVTCSFGDRALEADFYDENFRNNLIHVRIGHQLS
jgi:hypothetical protein